MGQADPRPEATRLGSYEILRKIARGGMAELFLARTVGPEGFEKLVVLKKILPHFAENPKFVRLFLDEARLAATLDHPHVAHVYDMGKVEGNYFFTMEYVHGQDVRTTLRRTAHAETMFPIDHAVQIAHAIAAALHYAHERRKPDGTLLDIVHRDVSPSNILISYDGAIKLVDFGVAKAATSSVKTRTGTLKGKIAYMSPEQARGSPIDRRSDIFSLGIVLWEMVTTTRLFKGENDLATIQLIVNAKPTPPRELRPECPAELERIILKTLAVELDQRYQTAEELQLDLEEFAREHKLKQSSVALRAHMQDLFAEEIKAWMHAQASGITLTDHVVSASVVEMTTPVSENELSFISDDGDDEEDDDESMQHPTRGQITTSMRPVTNNVLPVAPQVDHTPVPVVAMGATTGSVRPIQHTPSGPVRAPTMPVAPIIVQSPSGPIAMPPGIAAFPNEQPSHAGFPIAPREWRESSSPAQDARRQDRSKRLWIGGMVTFAVIVVIALAVGGSGGSPPARGASDELRPEPVETTQPAGKVDEPVNREPATPAGKPDTKAADTKAADTAETVKPADTANTAKPTATIDTVEHADIATPTGTSDPATPTGTSDTAKPVDTAKPADTSDTAKPPTDTKPTKAEPARTATRPAEVRAKPAVAKPAESTKTKPRPKPPEKKKPDVTKPARPEPHAGSAEYDPNSALPPP